MRLHDNSKIQMRVFLAVCIILLGVMLYSIQRENEQFRQTLEVALNKSKSSIIIDQLGYGKRGIMREEVDAYNKGQEIGPERQYIIYQIKEDKYVLISEISFWYDLAKLKVNMRDMIRKVADNEGKRNYQFTLIYATEEQKVLYEGVMEEFECIRELFNLQEVRKEGKEATIVTISFENPYIGTLDNVPMCFYRQ